MLLVRARSVRSFIFWLPSTANNRLFLWHTEFGQIHEETKNTHTHTRNMNTGVHLNTQLADIYILRPNFHILRVRHNWTLSVTLSLFPSFLRTLGQSGQHITKHRQHIVFNELLCVFYREIIPTIAPPLRNLLFYYGLQCDIYRKWHIKKQMNEFAHTHIDSCIEMCDWLSLCAAK